LQSQEKSHCHRINYHTVQLITDHYEQQRYADPQNSSGEKDNAGAGPAVTINSADSNDEGSNGTAHC